MLEKNIFHKIIQQVDEIVNKSANDQTKLNHAGNLFYQGSLIILEKAQECLENELHPEITVAGKDTQVDESFKLFLNSWTQQSISTKFLDEYLTPQSKAKYEQEANLAPVFITEDISFNNSIGHGEETSPTLSFKSREEWEFSYDENIEQWIQQIKTALEKTEHETLTNIVEITNLSQAQVFLTLLMMEIDLSWTGDFYESEINITNR